MDEDKKPGFHRAKYIKLVLPRESCESDRKTMDRPVLSH